MNLINFYERSIRNILSIFLTLTLLGWLSGTILAARAAASPQAGFGQALSFDGIDDWIETGRSYIPELEGMENNGLTLEAWYRGADADGTLASQGVWEESYGGYGLYLQNGRAVMSVRVESKGIDRQAVSSTTVNDNRWHHLAGVVDPIENQVRIFVDGELAGSAVWEDTDEFKPNRGLYHDFSLGRTTQASNWNPRHLSGSLDEVRLWKRALPLATLQNWAYRPLDPTHPNYADRLAEYRLDEGSGTSVTDAAFEPGNDGTIMGVITDGPWHLSGVRDWYTLEDEPLEGFLAAGDPDGSSSDGADWSLTFTIENQGSLGTASLGSGNAFTYSPNANAIGLDSFTYTVRDSDGNSSTATVNVSIQEVNDPPDLRTSEASPVFSEDGVAVTVDPNLTLTDPDGPNLTEATVAISANFSPGEDFLDFTPTLGIDGAYDPVKGILTLSGSASAADYETALRTVKFRNTSQAPQAAARTVTFTVGSGLVYEATGHFYEFISSLGIRWTDARSEAAGRTLFGLQGYLATITSEGENDFLTTRVSGSAWIGASDSAEEGAWRWVTGPESGTLFYSGTGASGSCQADYCNWSGSEPNDSGGSEDYGLMMSWTDPPGKWNDSPEAGGIAQYASTGYLVEYGGMLSDPPVHLSDEVSLAVQATNDAPTLTDLSLNGIEDTPVPFDSEVYAMGFDDVDGDELDRVRIDTLPEHGRLELDGVPVDEMGLIASDDLARLVFLPDENWSGETGFLWNASDGALFAQDSARLDLSVADFNSHPMIAEGEAAAVTMDEDGKPTPFHLVLQAADQDGDFLTWNLAAPPEHGTATAAGAGDSLAVAYVPAENFYGVDHFSISVNDGVGGSDQITIQVNVRPINDRPTGLTLYPEAAEEGQPAGTRLGTLLAQDPDDEDSFTFHLVEGEGSDENSLFSTSGDGLYTLDPLDFETRSRYRIRLRVTDTGGLWSEFPLTFTIIDVNESPMPTEVTAEVRMDTALALDVLANDRDPEGGPLFLVGVSQPTHGTVVISEGGDRVVYTPEPGFMGEDTFTYTVSDETGAVAQGTVRIAVTLTGPGWHIFFPFVGY